MEFFGIGPLEFLFILLIIFLVMGPEDMQTTARTLGRWLRRLMASDTWRHLTHTSQSLRTLPNRLAREAGLEESLRDIESVRKNLQMSTEEISRSLLEGEIGRIHTGFPQAEEGNYDEQVSATEEKGADTASTGSITAPSQPQPETRQEEEKA